LLIFIIPIIKPVETMYYKKLNLLILSGIFPLMLSGQSGLPVSRDFNDWYRGEYLIPPWWHGSRHVLY